LELLLQFLPPGESFGEPRLETDGLRGVKRQRALAIILAADPLGEIVAVEIALARPIRLEACPPLSRNASGIACSGWWAGALRAAIRVIAAELLFTAPAS
jgi:hypothetical protein